MPILPTKLFEPCNGGPSFIDGLLLPSKCLTFERSPTLLRRAASALEDDTFDAVVTSPPYSIALDYVKNDEHALKALGVDMEQLRHGMTGVRGNPSMINALNAAANVVITPV